MFQPWAHTSGVIARELHDALLARQPEALYEHEVQWMVDLAYRQMFGLQAVLGCAFRRQDHRFHDVVWQAQGNFEFT